MASPTDSADRAPNMAEPGGVDAQLELWRLRDAVIGAEATAGELRARLAVAEHTVAALRRPVTRRSRALGRATGLLRRLPGTEAARQRAEATLRSLGSARR
ncbi:MAG: hypothetical protein R2754_01575 [Microthrixaceae bacterium]